MLTREAEPRPTLAALAPALKPDLKKKLAYELAPPNAENGLLSVSRLARVLPEAHMAPTVENDEL